MSILGIIFIFMLGALVGGWALFDLLHYRICRCAAAQGRLPTGPVTVNSAGGGRICDRRASEGDVRG